MQTIERIDPIAIAEQQAFEVARRACIRSFYQFVKYFWDAMDPTPFVDTWHIKTIADHLQAHATGEIKNLIINIPPGHAKPVSVEALVFEQTKGRIKVSDVSLGDRLLTHTGKFQPVIAIHKQGVLPQITVTTHCGRQLSTAYDHPYLTTRGWVEAQNLQTTDTIATVVPQESFGEETVTPEEARLLGYLIGDGHTKYESVTFTNQDANILDDFERCAAACGFVTRRKNLPPSLHNKMPKASVVVVTPRLPPDARKWCDKFGQHPLRQWLDRHGLRHKSSYTKNVPDAIFKATPRLITEFVGAYWSCDGTVEHRGGSRTDCRVSATSVNRQLIEGLQHLLLRLGVQSRIRTRITNIKTQRQGDSYTSYNLEITSLHDVAVFSEAIKMAHIDKQTAISRYQLSKFTSQLREDPVSTIERTTAVECLCFSIAEDNSFTANDLVVHNSTICAVLWPAWLWTWNPADRLLCASYARDLAIRDSVRCRDLLRHPSFIEVFRPSWRMRPDQDEKIYFVNSAGGFRYCLSPGGQTTGWRGRRRIMDDPHNANEYPTRARMEYAINWWNGTMGSRLDHPATATSLVIMQRVHELDLTGWLLKSGEKWDLLCLPAEYESELAKVTTTGFVDPRQHEKEPLFPQQYPAEVLQTLKHRLGPYRYAAQYRQNPLPQAGGLVKRHQIRFYRKSEAPLPEECDLVVQSWDCAFKDTTGSDYVVGQVWARKKDAYYLLHQVRDRMDIVATLEAIRRMSLHHGAALIKLIEEKANGAAVVTMLQRKFSGVTPFNPTESKEARLAAVVPLFAAGAIFVPDPSETPWAEEWIDELCTFPRSAHDDQCDATSQALIYLTDAQHQKPWALV